MDSTIHQIFSVRIFADNIITMEKREFAFLSKEVNQKDIWAADFVIFLCHDQQTSQSVLCGCVTHSWQRLHSPSNCCSLQGSSQQSLPSRSALAQVKEKPTASSEQWHAVWGSFCSSADCLAAQISFLALPCSCCHGNSRCLWQARGEVFT